ncbi:MAG: hypothetical protein KDI62_00615 [Anaerolineae bacterium]|nr:hypothetical protein [Anaerolineae bacterium]
MTRASYEINTWQSILWRLIITVLLLLMLAGFSVSVLNPINQANDTFLLAPISQDAASSLAR